MSRPASGTSTPMRRSSPVNPTMRQPAPAAVRPPSPTVRARVASSAPVVGARRSSSVPNIPATPKRGPDVVLKSASNNRTTTPVGMVMTPRAGTRRSASESAAPPATYRRPSNSPARRLSEPPSPAVRNRPLSSSQKAITENEHKEMMRRVTKIMSTDRPLNSQHLFRITGSDEDLRLIHRDRCQRDPFVGGAAINCTRSRSSTQSKQISAVLNQSPSATRSATPVRQQSPSRFPVQSTLQNGLVPSKVEPVTKRKTYNSSPTPVSSRTASPVAPWTKDSDIRTTSRNHVVSPSSRNATPQRSRTLDFDPCAPIDAPRTKITQKDRHHLVFRDTPNRSRSGSVVNTILEDEPVRVTGVKPAALIARDVAALSPPQLPPPRKPSIKRNVEAALTHDIFNHPTITSVRVESPKPAGVHKVCAPADPGASNPNELVGIRKTVEDGLKSGQKIINHRNNMTAVPLGNVATADPQRRSSHTNVKCDFKYADTSNLIIPQPGRDPAEERKIRMLQSSPNRALRHQSDGIGAVMGREPPSRTQSPVASKLISKLQQSPMSQRKPHNAANRSSGVSNCLYWD